MKHKGLFSIIAAAPLLLSVPAQATELVLAAQSIGDVTVPSFQTNWASNTGMNDGIHFAAATGIQGPMSFAQFDPALGTLNSVAITVSGAFVGNLTALNQASATENTEVIDGSLNVTMTVDIFNDYPGTFFTNDGLIEFDGYTGHLNNVPALLMSSAWNDPALPLTLAPGETASDDAVSGASGDILKTFDAAYAQFGDFIGTGTFDIGCSSRSDDNFDTSGGSPLTGHEAWAECDAQITYNYTEDTPPGDVPAPAPLALIGLGLFGLASARRQRKS